jgi:hypothetical protein
MIAAVALMLSAGPAAAGFLTGDGLLEQCREYEKSQAGQDYSYVEAGLCLGYITGVGDMVKAATSRACPPEDANRGQVILVVIKFLKENPAKLHVAAFVSITVAMQEAWPCPK